MRQKINRQLADIVSLLEERSEGLSLSEIAGYLDYSSSLRTLQRRLAILASQSIVVRIGDKKSAKYFLSADYEMRQGSESIQHCNGDIRHRHDDKRQMAENIRHGNGDKRQMSEGTRHEQIYTDMNFSKESKKLLRFLEIPPYARNPVSY